MEQFVINIGRQLGSGGRTVGEIIARRLGVKLYDKELINLAARESGICSEFFEKADEKESRGVISTVVGYLRAPFVGDDGGVTNVLSNDALFKIQSDVIRAVAARESAVFVGRCADYILRENPRCVNVFLTADDADRIGRIRRRQGCTAEEARAMMERVDAGAPRITTITARGRGARRRPTTSASAPRRWATRARRISSWSSPHGN